MSKKHNICIWMNIPSHHQKNFFDALGKHPDVDLQVRYYAADIIEQRIKCGWVVPALDTYEKFAKTPDEVLSPDLVQRVQIIAPCGCFTDKVAELASQNGLVWCHWSERLELPLVQKVSYNIFLWKMLLPLYIFYHTAIKKSLYWQLLKNCASIVFTQGNLAQKSMRRLGVAENRIHDLYYSVNALNPVVENQEIKKRLDGKKSFLCCAGLEKGKGIAVLLRAFASLAHRENWRLVLLGKDFTDGEYNKLAKRLGIDDDVIFCGAVPSANVGGIMVLGDVFVLPTLLDGWGVVLNEAASLGKPIISTDECGAAWHMIKEGENGFRVKTGNVRALRDAMQKYVDDNKLIDAHGEVSSRIFEEFTPEKNVERLLCAFKTAGL